MINFVQKLVFLGIIIIFSFVASNNVVLIQKYSSTYITLQCNVFDPDASSFMIHLSCPFVKNGFCFSNCMAHCTVNFPGKCVPNPKLNAIENCKYNIINESTVSTSYHISTSQIHTAGSWTCSFKNHKSNSVSLAKYEVPTTTLTPLKKTVSIMKKPFESERETPITYISMVGTTMPQPLSTYKEVYPTKATKIMYEPNFLDYVTRPELVLVLIFLLGISLLLNLSFLIRCLLLKSVIENYYRGIPNSHCILECLCLDLVSNKYMNGRYSRSLHLSNQVGSDFYRCQPMCTDNMAIYDDLSAASNTSARIKMKSNHSSEMDEESRLANVLPNGGCHLNPLGVGSVSGSLNRRYTSPGHTAYFHPGLGNYVIVSGPVASYDQYSVGTAPPGYALQMVSPIPSAPGSLGGAPGTLHSTSSPNSDESDNDSRTALSASISTGLLYRQNRVNSQPIDFRDSAKVFDHCHNIVIPFNGMDHSSHYQHHLDSFNFIRSNGSAPLHPWPKENVIPTTSSISSLPYYTVSEDRVYNQELRNKNTSEKLPTPPKDVALVES